MTMDKDALLRLAYEMDGLVEDYRLGIFDDTCIRTVIRVRDALRAAAIAEPQGVMVPDYKELYYDLIMQVGNKYPGESRHDTAKRYIINAEAYKPDHCAAAKEPINQLPPLPKE